MRLAHEESKIDLLHVLVGRPSNLGMGMPAARELVDALTKQEHSWAESELDKLSKLLPESVRGEQLLREGPAAEVICEMAEELGHELIAVSTHGRSGIQHFLIGSVAERVVRLSKVPVVVVR